MFSSLGDEEIPNLFKSKNCSKEEDDPKFRKKNPKLHISPQNRSGVVGSFRGSSLPSFVDIQKFNDIPPDQTKKKGPFDVINQASVFGNDPDSQDFEISNFLSKFLDVIRSHKTVEGLFRKNGVAEVVEEAVELIELGEDDVGSGIDVKEWKDILRYRRSEKEGEEKDEASASVTDEEKLAVLVHNFVAVVKEYYHNIPRSLLDHEFYDEWKNLITDEEKNSNKTKTSEGVKNILSKLSVRRVKLIDMLFSCLHDVQKEKKSNMMGSENLAIVMTKIGILKPKDMDLAFFDDVSLIRKLVAFLIDEYVNIFPLKKQEK